MSSNEIWLSAYGDARALGYTDAEAFRLADDAVAPARARWVEPHRSADAAFAEADRRDAEAWARVLRPRVSVAAWLLAATADGRA